MRDFTVRRGLMEINFVGPSFTWSNRKQGSQHTLERLDWALCNTSWRSYYERAITQHESYLGSDHRPIILKLYPKMAYKKKQFWFDNGWLEKEESIEVIKENWNNNFQGSKQFQWARRLKVCQKPLSDWGKRSTGNTKKKIDNISSHIN